MAQDEDEEEAVAGAAGRGPSVPAGVKAELEGVRGELEGLAERLANVALDSLREAVAAGESRRPELERRVTRARHAVERAAGILADVDGGGEQED